MTFSQTEMFLYGAVLSAFWAVVGWVANHWLSTSRDRRNRTQAGKDEFLSIIAAYIAKLDTTAKYNEEDFFTSSLEPIGKAVHYVRNFLTHEEWQKLEQIWKEYAAQTKPDYAGGLNRVRLALSGDNTHHARLLEFFDRFRNAIKKE